MKLKRNHRSSLIVVVSLVLIMAMLTACSSATVEETKVSETVEVKEEVVEVEVAEAEPTAEPTPEPTAEPTAESTPEPEVETCETVDDWANTVDKTEPKLTIWNAISKEGIVLENEQTHVVKEGDQLVLCFRNGASLSTPVIEEIEPIEGTSINVVYGFAKEFIEPTVIKFEPIIDEKEYEFIFTVVSEDGANEEVTETGEDWANTLSFEEPKLLVWNDETGTREVIDSNGEYTLKDGDGIALYTPDKYEFDFAGASDGCGFLDALYEGQVAKIGYKLPEESMKLVLNHYMLDAEGGEIVASYTIITP